MTYEPGSDYEKEEQMTPLPDFALQRFKITWNKPNGEVDSIETEAPSIHDLFQAAQLISTVAWKDA